MIHGWLPTYVGLSVGSTSSATNLLAQRSLVDVHSRVSGYTESASLESGHLDMLENIKLWNIPLTYLPTVTAKYKLKERF